MLSVFAAAIVTLSEPSAAGLAGRFVQVQQALPGEQPAYEGWSKQQLKLELDRLDETRPGIGLPVTMIAVGAAIGGVDAIVVFFGGLIALFGGGGLPITFTVAAIVFAVGAVGLIVTGIVFLRAAQAERREQDTQVEAVREGLKRFEAPKVPAGPAPIVPPPASFPGPQVQLSSPWFAVTLARF